MAWAPSALAGVSFKDPPKLPMALRTGAQVQNPTFGGFNPTTVGQTPIFGAAQAQAGANQNAYNAQVGQNNAMTNGLFQLGAAAVPYFI